MQDTTLYIHGLDSSPNPDKLSIIQKYSETKALHLDYRNQSDAFDVLSELIEKEGVTHIVGSSLGGFLGFWLAEKYGLSCLLFNPAIGMKTIEMKHEQHFGKCPKRLIVIGQKDNVVLPETTMRFLESHPSSNCDQRIALCNNLEHQIDLNTFKEFASCFFSFTNN